MNNVWVGGEDEEMVNRGRKFDTKLVQNQKREELQGGKEEEVSSHKHIAQF